IGLIQLRDRTCIERISSPFYHPIENVNLRLLEAMALGRCQLCASFFQIGSGDKRFSKLTREDMRRAISAEKGVMFWNREVAERKRKLGLRVPKDGRTYERRFICPDWVESVWSKFALYPKSVIQVNRYDFPRKIPLLSLRSCSTRHIWLTPSRIASP